VSVQQWVAGSRAALPKQAVWQATLNFHHSQHHAPPPLPYTKLGKMPIRGVALAFDLCVLYYSCPVLKLSLSSKNMSKEVYIQTILSMICQQRLVCLLSVSSSIMRTLPLPPPPHPPPQPAGTKLCREGFLFLPCNN
jgi:hypothetical protein